MPYESCGAIILAYVEFLAPFLPVWGVTDLWESEVITEFLAKVQLLPKNFGLARGGRRGPAVGKHLAAGSVGRGLDIKAPGKI
jgi:hypothetical protein